MTQLYFTPVPELVGVEVTNRCDLSCKHCFNRSGEDSIQELSLADVLNLFDQLQEMGIMRIRLSGGEPTLHPEFPAIVVEAHRRRLRVSINTHGVYSFRIRQQIEDLPIDSFIVSLDGLRTTNDSIRGSGVFDQAVRTAATLHNWGRSVTFGVHLSRSNVNDVAGLIALAAQIGADVKFSPLRPIGRAQENLRDEVLSPADFYKAVKTITHLRVNYPDIRISTDFDILRPVQFSGPPSPSRASCPAGRSMLNVNYDGYVYPCAFLVTPQREFAAGHLHQAPLLTLWQEAPGFLPFRTLEKDAQCRDCFAYGQTCFGGCVAISYFTTGHLDAHDPTCFVEYVCASDLGIGHNGHN